MLRQAFMDKGLPQHTGHMERYGIKDYLPLVRKPSRYIGAEVNSVKKDLSKVSLRFALAFPDAYEVGMSHLGIQILYQILNAREDVACERVFAPWTDMEALLREKGAPLATLESSVPLKDFDIVGFSLQYELCYTNVLNMLDLGGIPLLSRERAKDDPFVIGGGPAVYNPEPVAPFFDAFLLGDGEEAAVEICEAVKAGKAAGEGRPEILRRLAGIEGVYVPSFFEVEYNDDKTVRRIVPLLQGYSTVKKRVVPDIDSLPLPVRPVVPFTETVHDRVTVEIARGCTRGCRFCAAGMIYRPVRERRPETVVRIISEAVRNTGYDEVSLLSLSAGDYTQIEGLLTELMKGFVNDNIALSLPSLRVGTLKASLASEIRKVRKTGFTMAPEAGSERLRNLINKGIKEEDLLRSAKEVFTLGWKTLKLYFMMGLPTETAEDILEITRLSECVRKAGRHSSSGRPPQINVSVSNFVPKPFTPFQWVPQISKDECLKRQSLLRKRLTELKLGYKWSDPECSELEGVFSRGDRRLASALINAFRRGARFDGWGDEFKAGLWKEAFREESIDPDFYTLRERGPGEVFPWDHLNPGVTKEFLYREYTRSLELAYTPDCKTDRCSNCGVCDHKVIKNVVAKEAFPGGSSGMEGGPARAGSSAPYRVRIRFSKTGEMRFLSHLELVSAVLRGVRRAGLPLKYSEGFHPMPRLSFSQPIPVGMESVAEHLDLTLDGAAFKPDEVMERLKKTMPEGIGLLGAEAIHLKVPQSSDMMAVEYLVFLKNGPLGMDIEPGRIDGFLRDFWEKDSFVVRTVREEKTAEVDVKPLVRELKHLGDGTLRLVLKMGTTARLRPNEFLSRLLNLSREDSSLIPILKTKALF